MMRQPDAKVAARSGMKCMRLSRMTRVVLLLGSGLLIDYLFRVSLDFVSALSPVSWRAAGRQCGGSIPPSQFLQRRPHTCRQSRGGEDAGFHVGDRVQAISPEDEQRYPATIDKVNPDGTFSVKWDDPDGGPETDDIKASKMKKIIIFKDYAIGDDVLAMSSEDGQQYPGVVSQINKDGTFQVKWDDPDGGPEVEDVNPEKMKKVTVFKDYKVDDAVEAVFPDDGQMYPGTVIKVNDDGTFQVKWDDSDGGPEDSPVKPKDMKYPPIPLEKLEIGQKFTGTVVGVREFGAFVDIGAVCDGLVHISRMSNERVEDPNDYVEVDQDVDVWISDIRDDGKLGLSMVEGKVGGGSARRPADLTAFESVGPDEWLSGRVDNVMPFGAFVTVTLPDSSDTATGLVHISQLQDGFVEDTNDVVEIGQEVQVRIISVELERGKMSLSMKGGDASAPGISSSRGPVDVTPFESVDPDEWLSGRVDSVMPFGAFVTVTLPDGSASASGLVHVSQLKDGFVEDVNDEVEVGQEVQARVINIDLEQGKLSLSMKNGGAPVASVPQDFSAFEGIPSDQWINGKVAQTAPFGPFVTVTAPDSDATADGLVHITAIRDGFVEDVNDEVSVGDEVQVRIISVDVMEGKMSLSMKAEDY